MNSSKKLLIVISVALSANALFAAAKAPLTPERRALSEVQWSPNTVEAARILSVSLLKSDESYEKLVSSRKRKGTRLTFASSAVQSEPKRRECIDLLQDDVIAPDEVGLRCDEVYTAQEFEAMRPGNAQSSRNMYVFGQSGVSGMICRARAKQLASPIVIDSDEEQKETQARPISQPIVNNALDCVRSGMSLAEVGKVLLLSPAEMQLVASIRDRDKVKEKALNYLRVDLLRSTMSRMQLDPRWLQALPEWAKEGTTFGMPTMQEIAAAYDLAEREQQRSRDQKQAEQQAERIKQEQKMALNKEVRHAIRTHISGEAFDNQSWLQKGFTQKEIDELHKDVTRELTREMTQQMCIDMGLDAQTTELAMQNALGAQVPQAVQAKKPAAQDEQVEVEEVHGHQGLLPNSFARFLTNQQVLAAHRRGLARRDGPLKKDKRRRTLLKGK